MNARPAAGLSRRRSAPIPLLAPDELMPIAVLELSGTGTTARTALASSPLDAVQ